MGADSWAEITTWFEWRSFCAGAIKSWSRGLDMKLVEAHGAAVSDVRGMSEDDVSVLIEGHTERQAFFTDAAVLDVSATAIRAAARTGDSEKLRESVPETVANYIEKYELYRN